MKGHVWDSNLSQKSSKCDFLHPIRLTLSILRYTHLLIKFKCNRIRIWRICKIILIKYTKNRHKINFNLKNFKIHVSKKNRRLEKDTLPGCPNMITARPSQPNFSRIEILYKFIITFLARKTQIFYLSPLLSRNYSRNSRNENI